MVNELNNSEAVLTEWVQLTNCWVTSHLEDDISKELCVPNFIITLQQTEELRI